MVFENIISLWFSWIPLTPPDLFTTSLAGYWSAVPFKLNFFYPKAISVALLPYRVPAILCFLSTTAADLVIALWFITAIYWAYFLSRSEAPPLRPELPAPIGYTRPLSWLEGVKLLRCWTTLKNLSRLTFLFSAAVWLEFALLFPFFSEFLNSLYVVFLRPAPATLAVC